LVGRGTPIRAVRVADAVWQRARERAAADGITVSDLIQAILQQYGEGRPLRAPGPSDV